MKTLKIIGYFISIAGIALIATMLVAMLILFSHFGFLPNYGVDPDPTATGFEYMSGLFLFCTIFLFLFTILQFVYLTVRLLVIQIPYQLVLLSFACGAALLLLFKYSHLYFFWVWALD